MGDVVEMRPEPRDGETAFMLCPCTKEGTPFAVGAVVCDRPYVLHLKCPTCEQVVPVTNGYIDFQG